MGLKVLVCHSASFLTKSSISATKTARERDLRLDVIDCFLFLNVHLRTCFSVFWSLGCGGEEKEGNVVVVLIVAGVLLKKQKDLLLIPKEALGCDVCEWCENTEMPFGPSLLLLMGRVSSITCKRSRWS